MNCLKLTLYPSLVLALLDENFVKKFGVKKGILAGEDIYMSGKWFSPWRHINEVDITIRDVVHAYLEKLGDCVGISISPGDEDLLFVVSFLTQNTNYHINVLRWTKELFSRGEKLETIAEAAPSVGRSYQLRRLPKAVREYISLGKPRDRNTLIQISGVGPKVADLFLLYTGDTSSPPVDKHFLRMAPAFGLYGKSPDAAYCRKYGCESCPLSKNCLRDVATRRLGRLAGWVQTLAYLIDKGVLKESNLNTGRGSPHMGWKRSL